MFFLRSDTFDSSFIIRSNLIIVLNLPLIIVLEIFFFFIILNFLLLKNNFDTFYVRTSCELLYRIIQLEWTKYICLFLCQFFIQILFIIRRDLIQISVFLIIGGLNSSFLNHRSNKLMLGSCRSRRFKII